MVTWEKIALGSIGEFSKGRGISKDEAHSGKIPCVRYGEIYTSHNDYVRKFTSHISESVAATSRRLKTGELLFAGSGETKEEIGKCVAFVNDCEAYAGGDIVILTPQTEADSLFLGYYLNSKSIAEQKASRGQGDAIVHISAASLAEIEIQLPSLPEQLRIAEVLSDTDALIAMLEKLIAKKRAIKQGAMQELLTGKRRLPGFEGEWVEKRLGDLFDITSSKRVFQSEWRSSGMPFYRAREIAVLSETGRVDNELFISKEMYEQYTREYGSIQANDVLITGVGTLGKVYVVKAGDKFYFKDGNIIWLKSRGLINSIFLRQLYFTESILNQVFGTSGGSTVGTYTIKNASETVVPYPPLAEQTAIAEILSDMDAEIDALTAKLTKLRNIKQGMMSELLTGRIRLTEQETETTPQAVAPPKIIELPKNEPQVAALHVGGHSQQFDDAVMIAGIVNVLYSDKFPLGRKKVQKCLYLLRRYQDESTALFKKKAAGPYADEVRYKGGEPIAQGAKYITTTTTKGKGTTFARGSEIAKALGYIHSWGKQGDIQWVAGKLRYKKVDELELLATVDMAICDLTEAGTPVSIASIKHLIATNAEWKAKLNKQTFSDTNIARVIRELNTLLQGGN